MFRNLSSYLQALQREKEVVEIDVEVDPYLELPEIHRRVIAEEGPALLFRRVKGSPYPVVTNLFGTRKRVELAFGTKGRKFLEQAVELVHKFFPPTIPKLYQHRSFIKSSLSIGMKRLPAHSGDWLIDSPARVDELPLLTTWELDGGPFITWPLVYTEDPEMGVHNLGIYRMQRYDSEHLGLHMQIGKGGGFHYAKYREQNRAMPVNVFLGGPPAVLLSAVAPLPENTPELLLASLLLGEKIKLSDNPKGPLPLLLDAEFVLVGSVAPNETRPEGPFGDHYGYYSLKHDYPVFRCDAVMRKRNAIYPATVVGKPKQEDFYIGDFLQELLSPLFPLVMPAVKDIWSYGETGYHSLAAAVVQQRYKREAMATAFRILGEGQLSLTKILLVVDKPQNLRNFPAVLEYILERANFRSDFYIFSHLSMDTLDYTGPVVNEGSKAVLLGVGEAQRKLPREFSGELIQGIGSAKPFCGGCLVVSGSSYKEEPGLAERVAKASQFADWPLIVLCDDAEKTAATSSSFLWVTFTRFEPAADVYAKEVELTRFHPQLTAPIVIDARMKPTYPDELFCDDKTSKLVDKKWSQYFKS